MDEHAKVVVLGHAIVDVLATCPDDTVSSLGLEKGTMSVVEGARASDLYAAIEPETHASGGSAANTAAGLASLGESVRFIGRVADDDLGRLFTDDIRRAGVRFDGRPVDGGEPTGRCLVLVTPDAEKTMCTSLGAGAEMGPDDIDEAAVAGAQVLYMEGYVWGPQPTTSAAEKAIAAARRSDTLVAFSASDPGWVSFQRDALLDLLGQADLLFANEPEALGLSGEDDLDKAVARLLESCPTVVVTLGAKGCLVASRDGSRVERPAAPVDKVVDTTGAGDSFAAGYLYGLVNDLGADTAAAIGATVASEVVGHLGARAGVDLRRLVAGAGLI
ncbi:MAG TPA: adenosine kinase [Acidimicrobiales bacterium]|jgi:sugar/nucleoside kinase (ribokinase family)|nr:adenosine kinase [Acidimicrobiales bacterium]